MYTTAIEKISRGEAVPLDELSERLAREIDHLERVRRHPDAGASPLLPQEIQRELRFLRQLSAGLACSQPGTVWFDRAGFGSVLVVRDESGRERFRKLVSHRLDPLDASQVPLASDLGQALRGRRVRDEVEVRDACGPRRLRIMTLKTLPRRLHMPVGTGHSITRTEESQCFRS